MHQWLLSVGLILALGITGCAPAEPRPVTDPFPNATEVRLFVQLEYGEDGEVVLSKPDGLRLSPSQRAQFESALVVEPEPEMMAACFVPHHFFRHYDRAGEEVGGVSVCFCCAGVRASGADIAVGPGQQVGADYGKLDALIRSLGERTDVLCE